MAIIRILKLMSSACDDNAIFLTREIPRLDGPLQLPQLD